jgi:hypothetical protein
MVENRRTPLCVRRFYVGHGWLKTADDGRAVARVLPDEDQLGRGCSGYPTWSLGAAQIMLLGLTRQVLRHRTSVVVPKLITALQGPRDRGRDISNDRRSHNILSK